MKACFTLFASILVLNTALSQMTATVTPVVGQFGLINEMPLKKGTSVGSVYVNDEWQKAKIYLKGSSSVVNVIENVQIKIDIKTRTIEINTDNGIKVLNTAKVEKIETSDMLGAVQEYVNSNQFNFEGTKLEGVCQVYGDSVKFVKHFSIEVIPADYNVALNVGSKEDRNVKKIKFYLLKDGNLVECSKKNAFVVMGDKQPQVKQFIKENGIKFNNDIHLMKLVDYYNSI